MGVLDVTGPSPLSDCMDTLRAPAVTFSAPDSAPDVTLSAPPTPLAFPPVTLRLAVAWCANVRMGG